MDTLDDNKDVKVLQENIINKKRMSGDGLTVRRPISTL